MPEEQLTPTPVDAWLKSAQPEGRPLKVPSGNICLVRPVGINTFLKRGRIPNALMPMITRAMEQAKGRGPDDEDFDDEKAAAEIVAELTSNPEKLEDVVELADLVTVETVVEPRVAPIPHWDEDDHVRGACAKEEVGKEVPIHLRKEGVLWVDLVDLEDKLFIFNFVVGGTRDLERFRGQSAAALDAVQPRKNVGGKAKRAPRAKKR